MSEIYLVTGANSGLGLHSVRRIAMMPSTKKIYMGCRSENKASVAIDSIKGMEGVDRCDQASTQKPVGPNQVLDIHQINLIGHVQLVEALKPKLAQGCKIVFSGSEAARGILIMMIGTPKLGGTSDWYRNQLEGKFPGYDPMDVYAKTKGFAALYFAEWARQNPKYSVLVVSPGGTSGTSALNADAVPAHFRLMMPVMMPLLKAMGVIHNLEDGTDRYIQALTGKYDEAFQSGSFVASKRGTTGEVCDQTELRSGKMYADTVKQKVAFEALSVYTTVEK
ncbi:short chain dehydrogenase [Seminavis robusta]|uniref:Short chain dehydrogenase n=1 Tax=Seminavis robusta TaxID=568900 RepID=A0A9N8DYQ4_9STRA|nr:short chain dehydrogenase [Seminavis robusta]|eukprot:Sro481_g151690.1 short chain dehydrogenase (279) ;mRNA; r:57432-58389